MRAASIPRFAAALALAPVVGLPAPAVAQQLAGSLETGLQSLAQTLVAGASPGQRPAISVMPFPSADQSCPVLSVFVVDELTTALVNAVQPRPRVVERMQLETIIAQNQLDDFLTDPEQRRKLGGLSGINALVVGSFVVIGDRLRINARLVGMESGEMIAAEAVSVPRTNEITELLRQGSSRGQNCLVRPAAAPSRSASGANVAAAPSASALRPPQPSSEDQTCDEQDGVRVCAQGVRRNGRDVQATLQIENAGSTAVAVAAVGPAPSLVDNDGATFSLAQLSGLPMCGSALDHVYMQARNQEYCLRFDHYLNRNAFRSLAPGARARVMLQFKGDEPSSGSSFALSAALAVLPRVPASMPVAEAQKLQARPFTVMLPEVRPAEPRP